MRAGRKPTLTAGSRSGGDNGKRKVRRDGATSKSEERELRKEEYEVVKSERLSVGFIKERDSQLHPVLLSLLWG
jgi:hypothetical protein